MFPKIGRLARQEGIIFLLSPPMSLSYSNKHVLVGLISAGTKENGTSNMHALWLPMQSLRLQMPMLLKMLDFVPTKSGNA